jgi:hypothetical protein
MSHGGVSSTATTVRVNDLNGGVDPLVSNLECVRIFVPARCDWRMRIAGVTGAPSGGHSRRVCNDRMISVHFS